MFAGFKFSKSSQSNVVTMQIPHLINLFHGEMTAVRPITPVGTDRVGTGIESSVAPLRGFNDGGLENIRACGRWVDGGGGTRGEGEDTQTEHGANARPFSRACLPAIKLRPY
jgi:hypothetical protein